MPVSVTVTMRSVPSRSARTGHAATVGCELDGVGQQVEHHLLEPQLVGFDRPDVVGDIDGDGDGVLRRALTDHRQAVLEGAADAECARLENHLACFDFGQVEDLVEQLQ